LRYEDEYKRKTGRSAKLFAESSRMHINGVSHNIRYYRPYPFVVRSSSGSHITDVDENCYTDYWAGHWSLILGHNPPQVAKALHEQIDRGWMYGAVNEQTIALSKMIADSVPAAEKIRYTASGTEAAMYATRVARSYTGRDIIVKVDGGWHGYASDLLKSVNWPFEGSESTGLVGDDRIVSVPYNNLDDTARILDQYSERLAGVIIEPVLGGAGCIPADDDYLSGVQELVHKNGSLFMLDEIVTGFRFGYGCLYSEIGLEPDIVTLGKIIGGGMPIGALCGKEDVMACADATKLERSYVGGGTFSANPASMVAGSATLAYLKKNQDIYKRIGNMGRCARDGLADALGGTAVVTGLGSMFMTHFTMGDCRSVEITDAVQAARCDQEKLYRYHLKMITQNDIFVLPGKLGAISAAHADADIDRLVVAAEEFRRDEERAK